MPNFAAYSSLLKSDASAINDISNDIDFKPTLSSPKIDFSDVVIASYDGLTSNFDIDDCSYESDNISVVSMNKTDDTLKFVISGKSKEGFGKLKIHINTADGEFTDVLYSYNNGQKTYFDKISKYQAWYSSMEDLYEQNLVSYEEINNIYADFHSSLFETTKNIDNKSANTTIVQGNIIWEFSNNTEGNKTLPLRNAVVEIGSKILGTMCVWGTGYTDEYGNYAITIDNSKWNENEDAYIRICLKGKTFEIKTFWFFPHYYYENKLGNGIERGSEIEANIKIKYCDDEDIYCATYIHQSMTIAERFAEEMGFRSANTIKMVYPAESGKYDVPGIDGKISLSNMAFCWGNIMNNCIAAIGINSYNNTSMIVHEYSHYIQCSLNNYGATLGDILIHNPNHDGISDYYYVKGDKKFATHLSWSEGWGYAFSVLAQKYYKDEYGLLNNYISNIPISAGNYIGEFQERTIKAFMWRLVDCKSSKIAMDYQIPWTPQEWWNVTTISGTCRLTDFVNNIEEKSIGDNVDYDKLIEDVAEYLSYYNISPEVQMVTFDDENAGIPPTIKFIMNGSEKNPNNRFKLKFYNESNQELANTDVMDVNVGHEDVVEIKISTEVWNEVISNYSCINPSPTIKICVVGYRYDPQENDLVVLTGPYTSSYYKITDINLPHTYFMQSNGSGGHTAICSLCGYIGENYSHNFIYSKIDETYHIGECSDCNYCCGTSMHVLKGSSLKRYQSCDACGAIVDTENGFYPIYHESLPNPTDKTK